MEWCTESLVSGPEHGEFSQTLRTLPILVVHAHSSCNCRCVMCDIWKTREAKSFGLREMTALLPSIRRLAVRWVVFSGGEPLMNAELPELCALLRSEGVRLTLLSTGLLFSKCAADIVANFDDVIVSLDGPPEIHNAIRRVNNAFELLQAGIQAVRNLRPDLPISARCTVQKANHAHLRETLRAARQLDLNGISFLAVDITSTAFNRPLVWPTNRQAEMGLSLAEIATLENEIENLILNAATEFDPGYIAESPEKLRRIVRHFRVQLGLERAEAPACNAPWVSAVIESDGTVRPCFFHRSIGNLSDRSLEEVVNGAPARTFRSNLDVAHNAICRNCVCSLNYRT